MASKNNRGRDVWAEGWKDSSYWLDGLTPPDLSSADLPRQVDVVIVGSGYTGLNAAIETARGGRSTLVLEAETPGWGCSTRNGGQISTSIKPTLEALTKRFGADRARAIRNEGQQALNWIEERIKTEGIECDFRRAGRFHAAHTPAAYEALARDAEKLSREEGVEAHMIPRAEQRRELGSDVYHGGTLFPTHASVNPALYHHGLLRTALDAGAQVLGQTPATAIIRTANGYEVHTPRGKVLARDVAIATNGYTTALTPWQQRRVIPIGSYVIATEPLPEAVIDELFPTNRVASDTCKVIYYYRASPDRTRILFGGRVSTSETDARVSGPRLHAEMCRIFPELSHTRISHSWMGTVAYTFDELAHIGTHDGMHFSMGYCGSGVSMASYLGMRMGQKMLGLAEGRTGFDDLPFSTRPFYTGRPWFLPAAVAWYRWNDARQQKRANAE